MYVSFTTLLANETADARLQPHHLCISPLQYGAVMIVDPEEEVYPEEVAKLAADVRQRGLGLLVFGEWYNVDVQAKMRFFDDNTRSWWTPITGGEQQLDAAGGTLCIVCDGADPLCSVPRLLPVQLSCRRCFVTILATVACTTQPQLLHQECFDGISDRLGSVRSSLHPELWSHGPSSD